MAGARITLTRDDQSPSQDVLSDDAGQFFFVNIAPGPFRLTLSATGFALETVSGTLHPSESYTNPRITLTLEPVVTRVRVGPEVAEEEIKDQEKQRVLGVVPNFYVTYLRDAAPLSPKQKFELAWKTTLDPVMFGLVGAVAGLQQARNSFSGSVRSRFLYAVATSVISKGDDGRWQPNYSSMLGSLAEGGISNLYDPPQDRGGELIFENALIGIGESAGANLLQEFVIPKLTPKKSASHNATELSQP